MKKVRKEGGGVFDGNCCGTDYGRAGIGGSIVEQPYRSLPNAQRSGKGAGYYNTKLEELTREVREHNHFAQRMPVVEEQIKVINHRIGDLENYHK